MLRHLITILFTAFTLLLLSSYIQSQSNSNTNINASDNKTAQDLSTHTAEDPKVKRIKDYTKIVADGAKELSGWCLLVIGASLAVIVNTSKLSPQGKMRSIYLLYIPGWLFLAISMYYGNLVARRYMMAALNPRIDDLINIGAYQNIEFANQLNFFGVGLIFFIAWLFLYVIWWIYHKPTEKNSE